MSWSMYCLNCGQYDRKFSNVFLMKPPVTRVCDYWKKIWVFIKFASHPESFYLLPHQHNAHMRALIFFGKKKSLVGDLTNWVKFTEEFSLLMLKVMRMPFAFALLRIWLASKKRATLSSKKKWNPNQFLLTRIIKFSHTLHWLPVCLRQGLIGSLYCLCCV